MLAFPKRVAWGSALALVASGLLLLPPSPAQAVSSTVLIAEVYGGGTNTGAANTYGNDFIELYNKGTEEVDLDGWSVQYHSAAGTGAFAVHELNGTIQPGGTYLLQEGNFATGTQFAYDERGTLNLAAGAGVVALVSNATPYPTFGSTVGVDLAGVTANGLVDVVGYGTTANTYEGARTGVNLSNTLSGHRSPVTADSDHNANDFAESAPSPVACGAPCAPPLSATDPGDKQAEVNAPIVGFSLTASGGTPPYEWTVEGLPAGVTADAAGAVSGSPSEAGSFDVVATVTDEADNTATVEFTITVVASIPVVSIAQVQGAGAESEMVGELARVRGVVTAVYPSGSGNLAGFFLQTGGEDGVDYDTPAASDAIFVYMAAKTSPALGTSVQVTGAVSEFFAMTQLTPGSAGDVVTLGSPLPAVVAGETVPGTDCALPGTDCLTGAALEAERERHEGEAFLPTGDYTVTDAYDGTPFTQSSSRGFQMQGEFGLAANSTEPLMIPTELYDQSASAQIAARRAYNDAHAVILDDGADIDYTSNTFEDTAFPWLTAGHSVRVGAAVEFVAPVILDYRRDLWRLQPQTKVAPGSTGSGLVTFEQTRDATPEDVLGAEGDLEIATFNMLNYFNTLGEEWAATDGAGGDRTCSYYTDKDSNRITNDECVQDAVDPLTGLDIELPGPRGAANPDNFARQEDKILEAINIMDADIMSLEEIENSIKLYDPAIDAPDSPDADRDDAISRLVQELNAHWALSHGGDDNRWAYAPSPRPAAQPTKAEQDAIRSGFIYDPETVELVGRSRILTNAPAMRNAREPLAQAFKPVGGGRDDVFAVIVNHFKSKGGPVAPATVNGDNVDSGDGAGFYNGDRKRQAQALVGFADQFADDKNIGPVFLTGDFNSYAMEDPVQVIEAAGYEGLNAPDGASTYNFGGLAGSLDHVFANADAADMVTGTDVWEINANESVYYEYSRFGANATNLYAVNPFRSSDHNPEIIGVDVGDLSADPDRDVVQVLATNDFHGRLLATEGGPEAGAASLAGAVKQLRADNPDTVFAAAGDLIGASTFESFSANDKPTIDALNEAGLEVSAAGNHEFDQGYDDLVDRVMAPYDADTNPEGGAEWQYIAGNVRFKDTEDGHDAGDAALPETWFSELADGRTVGFVGAVTEDLDALVAGSGIEDIVVEDIVDSVNRDAATLKSEGGCGEEAGCDLVVMLVHEGAATPSYESVTNDSTFAQIVAGASPEIDAIVSGHTHLAYNHKVPVPAWADRDVTARPVVSAGQYGAKLNRLEFEFEAGTDDLVNIRQRVVDLNDFDPDPATEAIVDAAVTAAAEQGDQRLGDLDGPFKRARRTDPDNGGAAVENRGGESTLGNLVAEIQRWKTDADIGFMNPGGLRADLLGEPGDPRELTYRQAADVQPFANTLVSMDLTGAEIKTILEQQWQRDADGNIPSRPFLRLGTSDGFVVAEDASRPEGDRITGMWLNGVAIDPEETYRVAATSFLASGTGDNFWGFDAADNRQDTGKTDLQAVVDYLAEFAATEPLPVDYAQHAVDVRFPGDAPEQYGTGDEVSFTLSSLAMTGVDDVTDSEVEVFAGDESLGVFPVTNALRTTPDDLSGTASVTFELPAGLDAGTNTLLVRGNMTGTEIPVEIQVDDGIEEIQIVATNDFHGRILNEPLSAAAGAAVLSGAVKQLRAANPNTVFAAAGDLIGASTFESFVANDKPTIDALNEAGLEVSAVGNHELDQGYDDLINRVMADDPEGGANWEYIAANLIEPEGSDRIAPSWTEDFGDIKVGFVGAVTEALPTLVSPTGIEDLEIASIVDSVNAEADRLVTEDGADLVIMLVHEGAPATDCATMDDSGPWAEIVNNVTPNVDAIVSGHTHLAYNCKFPVADWAGEAVTERPVVSAGQYGEKLNQLVFQVDAATGEIVAQPTQAVLNLKSCSNSTACTNYPADPEVTPIVQSAIDVAAPIGAQVLGPIAGPFNRAKLANGTTENRGGESTLGNLVAEVQRAETPAEQGGAQIAFMNPGGLRAEMEGTVDGGVRSLTYRQAANVQPFANGLVNMDLTGAQIEKVLEQQWSRTADGTQIPTGLTRYFLRLGVSKGFTYTYRETPAPAVPVQGGGTVDTFTGEVTGMWLNGEPIDPEETYSVTVNSFLAGGGDSFWELRNGQGQEQWGVSDLQAMTHYMDENTEVGGAALPVDYSQRAVEVHNLADSYPAGGQLTFDVESWSLSNATDVKDTEITVSLGDVELGTATLDNTVSSVAVDKTGKATIDLPIPAGTPVGSAEVILEGASTGTSITVPIQVEAPEATVAAGADQGITWGQATSVAVTVSGNLDTPTGTVRLFEGSTPIGSAVTLTDGGATLPLAARSLEPGTHTLRVVYSGDGTYPEAEDEVVLTVAKATPTVTAPNVTGTYGQPVTVTVNVTSGATGTVTVSNGATTLGSGPVSGGVATVTIPAGSLEPGATTLTAAYGGDSHFTAGSGTFTATVAKATSTVSAGNASVVYGKATTVTVNVSPSAATGTVAVLDGAKVIGTATVSGGVATVTLSAGSVDPGTSTLTAAYSGDSRFTSGSDTFTVSVAKAASTTKVKASPAKAKVRKTRVTLKITVTGASGVVATGKVKVKVPGERTETVTLRAGKATVKLDKFTSTGSKTIKVEYQGSDLLKDSDDTVVVRVKR